MDIIKYADGFHSHVALTSFVMCSLTEAQMLFSSFRHDPCYVGVQTGKSAFELTLGHNRNIYWCCSNSRNTKDRH